MFLGSVLLRSPAMPGRIKLSSEAIVEAPPQSSKRRPPDPIHSHAAKRTKPAIKEETLGLVARGAPQSSINDDADALKPPKEKQASKPRAKSLYFRCGRVFFSSFSLSLPRELADL